MSGRRTFTRVNVYPFLDGCLREQLCVALLTNYYFFFSLFNFRYRLDCSSNDIGLLNPLANPDDYHLYHCPCTDLGVPICPANSTQQGELFRYRSVSSDEFYDLAEKNISLWILRTYEELKDVRFVHLNET